MWSLISFIQRRRMMRWINRLDQCAAQRPLDENESAALAAMHEWVKLDDKERIVRAKMRRSFYRWIAFLGGCVSLGLIERRPNAGMVGIFSCMAIWWWVLPPEKEAT